MTGVQNQANYVSYECYCGFAPKKSPRFMPIALDFTMATGSNGAAITVDTTLATELDRLEFVQGVYIDNSTSGEALTLTFGVSNQVITLQAGYQGYLAVLAPNPCKFVATIAAAPTSVVNIQLLSFPVANVVWQA